MRVEKRKAESGKPASVPANAETAPNLSAFPPHSSALRSPLSALPPQAAFTLVELLVTMVIISIISAAILGTASAALDSARRSRTQTIINRIHLLLMERWGDYETRRIDVRPDLLTRIQAAATSAAGTGNGAYSRAAKIRGQMLADVRLLALRELMKYEMPDRWSDVTGAPLGQQALAPLFLAARPALADSYLRISANVSEENQGAECLYAIIMLGTGDGEARSQFTDQDIGDEDEDGAPEFLDGWGKPIEFIRWPAGYVGRSRFMTAELDPNAPEYNPNLALLADHDPFDLYRRDQPASASGGSDQYRPAPNQYPTSPVNMPPFIQHLRDNVAAFRLVPLVFSAGPDGSYDIISARDVPTTSVNQIALDPYAVNQDVNPKDFYLGRVDETDGEDTSADNIDNHSVEY